MNTKFPARLTALGASLGSVALLAGMAPPAPPPTQPTDVTEIEDEPVLPEEPLEVGDIAPNFKLRNAAGTWIELSRVLERGPVVLSFYRGVWCPYCNKELKSLERALPKMEKLGATVLALSPELRAHVKENVKKNSLHFDLLADKDNAVAKLFGVSFELDDKTIDKYDTYGIDVAKHNGTGKHELPIPATYVIDTDGSIAFAFTHEDYTKRAKTKDILKALEALAEQRADASDSGAG